MNTSPVTFIIFGRYPQPGRVKTRLAASIGNEAAADFYRLCAEHTFRQLSPFQNSSVHFYCSDPDDLPKVNEWIAPYLFSIAAQTGASLGERMMNAFDSSFQQGSKKVIIIGTDAPDISSEILQSSIDALDTFDIVIGPALDGGYYLLGMKQLHGDLFKDIPWSTEDVFQKTIEKAHSHNLSVQLLPPLSDIDTIEDLTAWRNCPKSINVSELFYFVKKL